MAEPKTLSEKVKNVGLMFLGGIIIVISLALFNANIYVFTIFLSLYIGIYSVVVVIYLYKKASSTNPEFNLIINVSLFTIVLLICVAAFALFLMNGSTKYTLSSKY